MFCLVLGFSASVHLGADKMAIKQRAAELVMDGVINLVGGVINGRRRSTSTTPLTTRAIATSEATTWEGG